MPVLYGLVSILFVFGPGTLLLSALGCRKALSLSCAPIATLFIYAVLSIILPMLGIRCGWTSIVLPALVVSFLAFLTRYVSNRCGELHGKVKRHEVSVNPVDIITLIVSLSVSGGLFVLYFHYLGGIDKLIQGFDTVYHVNLVRSFIESGNYSSLSASIYPLSEPLASTPLIENSGSFYPALWHVLCAMLVDATGAQIDVVANVTNVVLCGVAYPVGFWGLLKVLFPKDDYVLVAGSICGTAFFAFPWAILLRGEQFPQAAAFALVPSSVLLFINIFEAKRGLFSGKRLTGKKDSVPRKALPGIIVPAALFLCSLVALVFVQSNAVFTVGIFAAFYVAHLIFEAACPLPRRILLVIAWFVLVAFVWAVVYLSPPMHGVVSFSWDSYATCQEAVYDVLTLSLGQNASAQLTLGVLIMTGALYAVFSRKRRQVWLLALYVFAAFIYVIDVSSDGFLKHLLAGFWYTDPMRTAAMLALFGALLASLGLSLITKGIARIVSRARKRDALSLSSGLLLSLGTTAMFALCIYYPKPLVVAQIDLSTQFSYLAASLRGLASADFVSILDTSEQDFVFEAFANVPKGSVVINVPDDGSSFLFGLYDINVYYHRGDMGEMESTDSRLIRTGLADYLNNSDVRKAVEAVGAEYVLILDRPDVEGKRGVFHTYQRDMWSGIEGVDDRTPGFSLVLSEGDMALYKITDTD